MSSEAIGRRYARAIFEIGKENKTLPQLAKDIGSFAAMYGSNEELRAVLRTRLSKSRRARRCCVRSARKWASPSLR
jgi:F0F1-type ATP synthase delta subunit